jgi:hypothetical protein
MQHLLWFLTSIVILAIVEALPLLTVVVWLLCWLRVHRRTPIPKIFWAELILVSLALIPTFATLLGLSTHWTHPQYSLFGRSLRLWGLDALPAILALPAAVIYRRLPGYLLTSRAGIQTIQLLLVLMFYRGASVM